MKKKKVEKKSVNHYVNMNNRWIPRFAVRNYLISQMKSNAISSESTDRDVVKKNICARYGLNPENESIKNSIRLIWDRLIKKKKLAEENAKKKAEEGKGEEKDDKVEEKWDTFEFEDTDDEIVSRWRDDNDVGHLNTRKRHTDSPGRGTEEGQRPFSQRWTSKLIDATTLNEALQKELAKLKSESQVVVGDGLAAINVAAMQEALAKEKEEVQRLKGKMK